MTERRSFLVPGRVLLGIVLVLLLGGPTPGAVGDCSDDEGAFVPASDWCFEKEAWLCERRRAQGTYTDAERDNCLELLNTSCPGRTWPDGCTPPTEQTTRACIAALMSVDRLGEAEADIVECKSEIICGGGL